MVRSVSKISGDSSEARVCCGLRGMGLSSMGESDGSCLMTNPRVSASSGEDVEEVAVVAGRGSTGAMLLMSFPSMSAVPPR